MTDNIVNLSQHKSKIVNEIRLNKALRETESYESVIHKSLRDWHTYSVQEKAGLYETVALFNIELLNQLINKMKENEVE